MATKESNSKFNRVLGGLLVILFITGMYYWLMPDNNWQGTKVVSGEKKSIKLPDGSMAHLVGPSQVGFPKEFNTKVRNVKMNGEIYFEVVNDSRYFLLQTEKGGVETQGASFTINTKKKKNIKVQCVQGKLRFIAKGKKEILETNLLSTEMVDFTKGDKVLTKQTIDSILIKGFIN